MNTSFQIRPAETRDAARLRELLEQICQLHVEGRPDLFRAGAKYTVEDIVKMLDDTQKNIFVADTGDDIAGYIFCQFRHINGSVMRDYLNLYIDDLCVDPKYRRMGVGRALFERAKKLAYDRGAYNIDLNVWAFNESAIKFYESLGMKPSRMNMELITGKEKL